MIHHQLKMNGGERIDSVYCFLLDGGGLAVLVYLADTFQTKYKTVYIKNELKRAHFVKKCLR